MKAKQAIVVVAFILSIIFGGIYLQFFSDINSTIKVYVCQVGIYKEAENANAMKEKLVAAGLGAYEYKREENIVVISDVFTSQESADELGKKISEMQMTCVVREYKVSKALESNVNNKKIEEVLKELGD